MSDITTVTVSVPAARVGDLYAYVATLHGNEGTFNGASDGEAPPPSKKRAANGFGRSTVRKHYFGGVSNYWRPFLEELADHPDEWVAWSALCEAINLDAKKASGMLGAAERRCKGYPPYEKTGYDSDADDYWFYMPAEVAGYIKEAAAELDDQ